MHLNSTHSSVHSLDADLLLSSGESFNKSENDMFKDGLRRAQSTDSLGTSGSLQSKALGYNNKAKSAGNLDESDFGPLVGADSVSENYDTASLGSLQMPSGFMLTKDQEKAIKAMTPEQEETASLLSSVTQGVESAYVSPSGYRLVSETEWNLLQKEVSAHRASAVSIPRVAGGCVLWAACGKRLLSSPGCALLAVRCGIIHSYSLFSPGIFL